MEISHNRILIALLIGLRGCITPNIRAVSVDYSEHHISIYFYYQEQPSEMEVELAEEVATEVIAYFPEIALKSFETNKIVISYPNRIPDVGFLVFQRYEPTPEGLNE